MRNEIIGSHSDLNEERTKNEYSDEESIRAAYALNKCMVSVSQIIDYADINVLEQEYEAILNNLNLEMIPKDESLLKILKRVLDTIIFFRLQEGEKKLIDKEYQQKVKDAIWNAVPTQGINIVGGDMVSLAVSLACEVGISYMNYRRAKAEIDLLHEREMWQLQESAIEQFNGLRRELFDTAWRLADAYNFPDAYRLTERQIKQYDEILMDSDEIRKYERLTTISDKFIAYPPFWYHYGSTANHIARNKGLPLSDIAREQYFIDARKHFDMYWKSNKYALLREDYIASACALEHIDLLDVNSDRTKIGILIEKAVSFSGNANDILQLCAIAYLRIGEKDKAANLFRILVNEQYNIIINAQLLSGLYVSKVISSQDNRARSDYETLATRVNKDYLIRLPKIGEVINQDELKEEFTDRQKQILKDKFSAVIRRYSNDFSIRLGRLIPGPNAREAYPDFYFSEEGTEQRIKDFKELFSSSYKQKKRNEYLERLAQAEFVPAYFRELNMFFDDILELNCIRDRQKLQRYITERIVACSVQINTIAKKIEDHKVGYEDMCQLLAFTSINMFAKFNRELSNQVKDTISVMNDMSRYAATDSKLREFCAAHNLPEPEVMLASGTEAKPDTGLVTTYFGIELLDESGTEFQMSENKYEKVEHIIRMSSKDLNSISDKARLHFHESEEFNTYFEASKLKNHKDILQKTIAVLEDKSLFGVDVIFTIDELVPVIKGLIMSPVPYLYLMDDEVKKEIAEKVRQKSMMNSSDLEILIAGRTGVSGLTAIVTGGKTVADTKTVNHIVKPMMSMFEDICYVLVEEFF